MKKKKHPQNQHFDFELVEKWLEDYFLDPLTSYLDQTQFKIDLYETEKEWIVEAILTDFEASEIKVYIEDKILMVSAAKYPSSPTKQKLTRSIDFPFQIMCQEVTAAFSNGVLEVFISKTDKGLGKNRFITLP